MKTQNRPLTQEELKAIKSAPEWATHCTIYADDVLFESERYYLWKNEGVKHEQGESTIYRNAVPIPQKQFDIESAEWSDVIAVKKVEVKGKQLVTHFKCNVDWMRETKQDIINKAKALGITPEDLK